VGNGTAQWSKPNRQREELGLARRAKMPLKLPQELLGNAHRCRYTAEHFVGSVICSRIAETTFPSSRIENPSDGSIRSGPRLAVAEAQNTRAPASQAAPATPRQHKIWFSISSLESVPLCVHLKQQSPKVLQLLALLQGRLVPRGLTGSNRQFGEVCIMKLSHFRGSLHEFQQKSYGVNPAEELPPHNFRPTRVSSRYSFASPFRPPCIHHGLGR
jgi:hypothetical protein